MPSSSKHLHKCQKNRAGHHHHHSKTANQNRNHNNNKISAKKQCTEDSEQWGCFCRLNRRERQRGEKDEKKTRGHNKLTLNEREWVLCSSGSNAHIGKHHHKVNTAKLQSFHSAKSAKSEPSISELVSQRLTDWLAAVPCDCTTTAKRCCSLKVLFFFFISSAWITRDRLARPNVSLAWLNAVLVWFSFLCLANCTLTHCCQLAENWTAAVVLYVVAHYLFLAS